MIKRNNGCLPIVIPVLLSIVAAIVFSLLVTHIAKTVYWKWLLLFLPIIFIVAYFIDAKEKREKNEKRTKYLKAGGLIFSGYQEEFSAYYESNIHGKKNKEPIDVLCEFAEARGLVQVIDWRGEEKEREIEDFIEKFLGQEILWRNSSALRSGLPIDGRRDGEFIVDLFKAVDKDLLDIGQRLLFLGSGDSYEYTVVDSKTFNDVCRLKISGLQGASGDPDYK